MADSKLGAGNVHDELGYLLVSESKCQREVEKCHMDTKNSMEGHPLAKSGTVWASEEMRLKYRTYWLNRNPWINTNRNKQKNKRGQEKVFIAVGCQLIIVEGMMGLGNLPFGTYRRTECWQSLKVPPHKILTTKGENSNLKATSLIKW